MPVSKVFGLGHDQGVENDIEIKSWSVLSTEGIRSDAAFPYLRGGEVVHLEVVLGFENTTEGVPRSGQALVRFLVDGNEYATTTLLEDGVALFPYTVPNGRPSLDLGVEVVPCNGQDVVSNLPSTLTFLFDNVPILVDRSVERFDSRDIAPRTPIVFTVADRPHLPTHANVYLWQSWIDDDNANGVMDADEVKMSQLELPENLSTLMGEYRLSIDSSAAEQGDYFVGWVEIADSAGHIMEGGGSLAEPMFHVQLKRTALLPLEHRPWAGQEGLNPHGSIPMNGTKFGCRFGNKTVSSTLRKSNFSWHQIRQTRPSFNGTKAPVSAHHWTPMWTLNHAIWSLQKLTTCFPETGNMW